ncbi:MAG: Gfo/Idh/MocA family oxidoreductase [Oscillospiraceae bacterium]|nr:Gfo/Idh/MocA family oxidoreductase [Oscillospiraceae bacterium]
MKKLAMIGCGGIGGYHLEHFVNFKDIELVGFCDLIAERAENFVRIAGKGKSFTDFRKMYDETKPDMVLIGIPPYAHGEIEFETINRGIHLFVEKPVSLNLSTAKEIRDKIAEKKIISAVGFQCRYDNINEAAKDFISKNEIVTMQGSRVGGVPEVDWWRKKDLSGGQLVEQTVHQMDMLRYLLGDVDTVYSIPTRGFIKDSEWVGYDTDDVSTTIFKFKSGIVGTMMTGCYSLNGASWDSKITIGTRGSRLDYILCGKTVIYGVDEKDIAAEIAGVVKGDGMQRRNENEVGITVNSNVDFGTLCDRTFIDAVISGDPSKIRSPYSDALKSVAFVLACNESMKTGQPVKVEV